MALASTNFFASFDVTDKTQEYDISALLLAALMVDTGLLGIVPMGAPATDTTHYWTEQAINVDQVVVDGTGYNSASTAPVLAAGHGARLRVGALLKNLVGGNAQPEVVQVTNIATDTLTVVRAYGGTTAVTATFAANTTLDIISMPLQEGSDIDVDRSTTPSITSNFTQIFERSVTITRNQMKRPMVSVNDFLALQLHNRTMELKRELERTLIHSRASASAGSDTVYRTMKGLLQFITGTSVGGAYTYALFNTQIKNIVDAGAADDVSRLALLAPTKIRQTISGFDASNRRLVESDRRAGYYVEQLVSDLGVVVDVVTSNYLGNATPWQVGVLDLGRIKLCPFQDDMFKLMAAQDWVDGVKRRILGEFTLEVRDATTAHSVNYNLTG